MTSLRRTVDEQEGTQCGVLDAQVFHVDFGSSEWVSVGDVKPLVAKFLSLPGQVVRCRLANLKPEGVEGESFISQRLCNYCSKSQRQTSQCFLGALKRIKWRLT